jgi:hypothetical protein
MGDGYHGPADVGQRYFGVGGGGDGWATSATAFAVSIVTHSVRYACT